MLLVFRIEHLVLNKQLVCSSMGDATFPAVNTRCLPVIIYGLGLVGIFPSTLVCPVFLPLFSWFLGGHIPEILEIELLALLSVIAIRDYIWNELQFRNRGHTCERLLFWLVLRWVNTFLREEDAQLWSRSWGWNIHLESGSYLLLEAYTMTKKPFLEWKRLCSLPACPYLVNTSILSLALKPTLEFQHIVKTSWDIQPFGLINCWIFWLSIHSQLLLD